MIQTKEYGKFPKSWLGDFCFPWAVEKKKSNAAKAVRFSPALSLILTLITMLVIANPFLGLVLAKDYDHTKSEEITKHMVIGMVDIVPNISEGVKKGIDSLEIVKAPNVEGLKIEVATKKLKAAKIKDVKIEKEKMTFEELVQESEDLFFDEVKEQKQDMTGVTLCFVEADEEDPLTKEMVQFGSRLAWPVPSSHNITSHFGHRSSPGGIGSTNHQGMDIAAVRGTPIIAAKEGEVKLASSYGGYGNCVIIQHENNYETLYGHMSAITCNVGDKVKPGDVIGKIGSTGWSTGPHLHFGIMKAGQFVDPEPYFTGKVDLEAGDEVSENNSVLETTVNGSDGRKDETSTTQKDKSSEPSSVERTTKPTTPSNETEGRNDDQHKEQKRESTTSNTKKAETTESPKKETQKKPTTTKPTQSETKPVKPEVTTPKPTQTKPKETTPPTTRPAPPTNDEPKEDTSSDNDK